MNSGNRISEERLLFQLSQKLKLLDQFICCNAKYYVKLTALQNSSRQNPKKPRVPVLFATNSTHSDSFAQKIGSRLVSFRLRN